MRSPERRRQGQNNLALVVLFLLMVGLARQCDDQEPASARRPVAVPVENPIQRAIQPATPREYRDGVAAALLIDTSRSMGESVKDADGVLQPKIKIAQSAAMKVVEQFDQYSRDNSGRPILLGVYEFSNRDNEPPVRAVIPPGPPDAGRARDAILKMRADGGTPIGNAIIQAKLDVDTTSLARRHIVVITDGENTQGYRPEDVTRAIANQSENDRASIYFIAFDIAASKFNSVKEAGGLVLAASNETDLRSTLDYLLTGKILAEQPAQRQ